MKQIIYAGILILSLNLYGCFLPLPQWEMIYRSSDVDGQVNEDGYFEVWVDQTYWPKHLDIVGNLSWVKDPNGKKLHIDYEKGEKPYKGKWYYKIYPVSENGKRLSSLSNGKWKISLHLQNGKDLKIKELEFKLWTFFYNPLIHGAPN